MRVLCEPGAWRMIAAMGWCVRVARAVQACLVQFSLDYKGLQPGTAAQPIGPNNKKIDSCIMSYVEKQNLWYHLQKYYQINELNWCRKCSVPMNEKITRFSSWISSFSHKLQTHALLYGLLPYKPVSHFNPCPRILNRATFLMTFFSEPSSNMMARAVQAWC
jgi:hypothetical protein